MFSSDLKIYIDAAGSCGFQAIWETHWCCGKWPDRWVTIKATKSIVVLEVFPLVVALEIWGEQFANKRILIKSDKKVVIYAVNCLSAKSIFGVKLLRYLVILCLRFNIWLKARHVLGKEYQIADALS